MKQLGTVTSKSYGERGAALVEASIAILPYLTILASFLLTSVLFSALALCTSTALHAELARRAYDPDFPTPEIDDLVVGFSSPALRAEALAHQTESIADTSNRRYMEYLNYVAGVLNRVGYPIGAVDDPSVSSAYVVVRSFDPSDPLNERSVKEVHIATNLISKLGIFASVLSSDRFTGGGAPPIVVPPVIPVDPVDDIPASDIAPDVVIDVGWNDDPYSPRDPLRSPHGKKGGKDEKGGRDDDKFKGRG